MLTFEEILDLMGMDDKSLMTKFERELITMFILNKDMLEKLEDLEKRLRCNRSNGRIIRKIKTLMLKEKVTWVHHWTDKTFSFKTTRSQTFRFNNGEFAMIGLMIDDKPLLRAYSIASANYEDELEFLSIKVSDGSFTSHSI